MNDETAGQAERLRVVTAAIECLNRRDPSVLLDLLDADVEMSLPFASGDHPVEVDGRQAVIDALRFVGERFDSFNMGTRAIYNAPQSDAVIMELTCFGRLHHSNRMYQNRYVAIFRFRGNRIAGWTEYFNPEQVRRAGLQ